MYTYIYISRYLQVLIYTVLVGCAVHSASYKISFVFLRACTHQQIAQVDRPQKNTSSGIRVCLAAIAHTKISDTQLPGENLNVKMEGTRQPRHGLATVLARRSHSPATHLARDVLFLLRCRCAY